MTAPLIKSTRTLTFGDLDPESRVAGIYRDGRRSTPECHVSRPDPGTLTVTFLPETETPRVRESRGSPRAYYPQTSLVRE